MNTFGNTTIKATLVGEASGFLAAVKYPLAEEGQIISISIYLSPAVGDIRCAIYSDDAGAPNALQCETGIAATAVGWNVLATNTNPVLQPGNYWIAIQVTSDTSKFRTQAGSTNQGAYRAFAWAAFPNPFGTPDVYQDDDGSFYSSYNPIAERAFAQIF